MKQIIKQQDGLGLVEVIAALGISVVVITSLLSLTLFSLRTSLQSTLLMEGTKAANTQMELLRAYRDGSVWVDFVSAVTGCAPPSGCYVTMPTLGVVKPGQKVTMAGATAISTRFFTTAEPGNMVIHVTVQSDWDIGGQNKKTFVYSDLTN